MSKFTRKGEDSGFTAGDLSEQPEQDFAALEAGAGETRESADRVRKAATADTGLEGLLDAVREAPTRAEEPASPEIEETRKKRYYSPGEVMKKKGCIGCGGMVLAMVVMAILALVVVL